MWSARVKISLRRPTVTLFYLTNDWVPHEKLNEFELGTGSPSQRTRSLDADPIPSRGSRRRRRRRGPPPWAAPAATDHHRLHLHSSHMPITSMLLCRSYRRYGHMGNLKTRSFGPRGLIFTLVHPLAAHFGNSTLGFKVA